MSEAHSFHLSVLFFLIILYVIITPYAFQSTLIYIVSFVLTPSLCRGRAGLPLAGHIRAEAQRGEVTRRSGVTGQA